jgi:hypothetical protein
MDAKRSCECGFATDDRHMWEQHICREDAREQAEKIQICFNERSTGSWIDDEAKQRITAELQKAEARGYEQGVEHMKDCKAEQAAVAEWTDIFRREAVARGMRMAAEIAFEHRCVNECDNDVNGCYSVIHDKIRAKADELEKGATQ